MAWYRMRRIFVEAIQHRGAPYAVDEAEWVKEHLRVSRSPGRRQQYKIMVEAFAWDGVKGLYPDWFVHLMNTRQAIVQGEGTAGESMTIQSGVRSVTVNRSDYVIRGFNGDIYPCPAESFKWRYEAA